MTILRKKFQLIFWLKHKQVISIDVLWYLWRSIERLFFELSITELKKRKSYNQSQSIKEKNTYMFCKISISNCSNKNSISQFIYKDTFFNFFLFSSFEAKVHVSFSKQTLYIVRPSICLSVCKLFLFILPFFNN